MVVDVAVEDGDDVRRRRAARLLGLLAVDRVGVGLGDDPDAGPAGVAEHGDAGRAGCAGRGGAGRRRRRPPRMARVLSPSSPISAAALWTIDRHAPGEAHRPALEQRVATAGGQRGHDRRVVGGEVVVPHEDVDAGGVAAADLHAVDRRQRLLDRQVAGEGGRAGVAAGEVGDGRGGAQAVAADRPTGRRAGRWRAALAASTASASALGGERGVDVGGVGVELVEPGGDRGDELVAVGQRRATPGKPVEQVVDLRARPRRRRAGSPRRASAASRPPTSSAAVGVGRDGSRLTMPTMPHMTDQASDGFPTRSGSVPQSGRDSSPPGHLGGLRPTCW